MNREYHKWYSSNLQREMELLVFGTAGTPMLVFPTSCGRFFDYEERGMIGAVADQFEQEKLQAFCVDSVDAESWYNKAVAPRQRVERHNQYEKYVLQEVISFIHNRNTCLQLVATGCSFGGYHTINFALRHPELVTHAVSMGGAFDIHQFLDGYYDEDCYFQCPTDYLPNLTNDWYLDHYRNHLRMVLATGENDICLQDNLRLSGIMNSKQIPHWLDVWGDGAGHDWPWWQRMAAKYWG